MPVLKNLSLDLTFEEVVKYHGLKCRGLVSARTAELLQSIIDDVEQHNYFLPNIAYNIISVKEIKDGCLHLENQQTLPAPLAAHRLKKASHILFGVCSLGEQIGTAISQLFNGKKRLQAVLMEEFTNYALFKLSTMLEIQADIDAGELGLSASGRLNPGDDGFDLSSQAQIIEMAGAPEISVTINAAQMMSPLHSLSVVFGIGKDMPKWTAAQSCENCRAHDRCRHRIALEGLI